MFTHIACRGQLLIICLLFLAVGRVIVGTPVLLSSPKTGWRRHRWALEETRTTYLKEILLKRPKPQYVLARIVSKNVPGLRKRFKCPNYQTFMFGNHLHLNLLLPSLSSIYVLEAVFKTVFLETTFNQRNSPTESSWQRALWIIQSHTDTDILLLNLLNLSKQQNPPTKFHSFPFVLCGGRKAESPKTLANKTKTICMNTYQKRVFIL